MKLWNRVVLKKWKTKTQITDEHRIVSSVAACHLTRFVAYRGGSEPCSSDVKERSFGLKSHQVGYLGSISGTNTEFLEQPHIPRSLD